LFERLHEDRARRENNYKYKEQLKVKQEVQYCTFNPTTLGTRSNSMKRGEVIYDKLYSDYDVIQRKKLKKQYEREARIKEELTFKP